MECKIYLTYNVKRAILKNVKRTIHHEEYKKGGDMKNRIQELRKEQKIRQEDLAEAVGVTRQTIISLENGKYNASLQLAYKLARYFHRQIEEIFLFEEE